MRGIVIARIFIPELNIAPSFFVLFVVHHLCFYRIVKKTASEEAIFKGKQDKLLTFHVEHFSGCRQVCQERFRVVFLWDTILGSLIKFGR